MTGERRRVKGIGVIRLDGSSVAESKIQVYTFIAAEYLILIFDIYLPEKFYNAIFTK